MESFLATHYQDWSVFGIPAFTDNYLWAVVHTPSKQALLIDPGCAHSVEKFLHTTGYHLAAILVTHHHDDHVGGIVQLRETFNSQAPVFGPNNAHIPSVTHPIAHTTPHGSLPIQLHHLNHLNLPLECWHVPGHTNDHLAWLIQFSSNTDHTNPSWLFCGDTLFAAGCGRLLGGTGPDLYKSLQKINQLPTNTLIFCAHEYTENNLRFAHHEYPEDDAIKQRLELVREIRSQNQPTIPTTLEKEQQTNVFLNAPNEETFIQLRRSKDHF